MFRNLLKIPFYKHFVDISPDSKSFLYSSNFKGKPQLFLRDLALSSDPKQITPGRGHVSAGYFSPNELNIVMYPVEKYGNEKFHLFLLDLEQLDRKPTKLTKKAYRTFGLAWNPKGTEVIRAIMDTGLNALEVVDTVNKDNFLFDNFDAPLGEVQYSSDGKWLTYSLITGGGKGAEVHVRSRKDPQDFKVISIKDDSTEDIPCFSPDGKWLAFVSDSFGRRQPIIQNMHSDERIYLHLEEEEEILSNQAGVANLEMVWHSNSEKIYYLYSKHSRAYIRAHYLNDVAEEPLPFPEGELGPFKLSKDSKMIVSFHSSMSCPPGIYLYRFKSNQSNLITPRNYDPSITESLSHHESIWYSSFDNTKIHGWYIPAVGASIAEPKPAVVYIHGGPTDQVFNEWTQGVYLHAMSQSGLSVFAINYRGSTGYGTHFQNLNKYDMGGGDLEDVVYAAKWLRTRPEVDKDKIAIAGGSYGGFMVLIALSKKPQVFNAGISLVPVVDWRENFSYQTDDYYTEFFGGTPEEKPELFADRSPITHVNYITAPVLIIAGTEDARCPIEPIRKFVDILKKNGKEHHYIEKVQDGHSSFLERASERIEDFSRILQFLENVFGILQVG